MWLTTADQAEAQKLLATLITEQAEPVIKNIVSYKLRTGVGYGRMLEDAEDLCSEIILKVLTVLQQVKTVPPQQTIQAFRNYVAVIAHNTCAEYLRHRSPQRQRLKDKIRYLLTRQPGLALWENTRRVWLGGFVVWQKNKGAAVPATQALQAGEEFFVRHGAKNNLVELLDALFHYLGGPVELDTLVSLVALQTNVKNHFAGNETPLPEILPETKEHFEQPTTFSSATEQRLYLQQIWLEIGQLPLPNRTALLLNLRDADDKGLVALLADLKIVSLPEIAEALALAPTHFAQLWQALPLDDNQIATLLGVTRQQVINLRKAARKWLVRQLHTPPIAP